MNRILLLSLAFCFSSGFGAPAQAADATRKTDAGFVLQPPSLPSVLTPAAGQIFYAGSPIAIKLAPPNGLNVTEYLLRIEKKDAKGSWFNYTADPISVPAAQAQSADGYRGFVPVAGTWRLTAIAFRPTSSYWSNPVEFTVRALPANSPVGVKK